MIIDRKEMYSMIKECPLCRNQFITSANHKFCKFCFKKKIEEQNEERRRKENDNKLEQKKQEQVQFENAIKAWDVVAFEDIAINKPLYIIGNGFDLLHGVKSSYYDFKNSFRKNNYLKWLLETYLNVDDIWGDFEEALGHLNVKMMANYDVVDTLLDAFDAYNEDSSYADFFAASEEAASPAITIANDLQRSFRRWIESLIVPTSDRPLTNIIKNAPVLNFNYTEFIETFYGVDHNNVCYIHGCRKKLKNKPKDKLILGHTPGANDSEYYFKDKCKINNSYRRDLLDIGKEIAIQHISESDEALTKHCADIIRNHHCFFDELDVTEIIVLGHSLSVVDWDYFKEIVKNHKNNVNWYISCYGLKDLERINIFAQNFNIASNRVHLFRIDGIRVKNDIKVDDKNDLVPKERILYEIEKCSIRELNGKLNIYDNGEICYSLIFPGFIKKVICFDKYLLIISDCIYLLSHNNACWKFINELEPIQNQDLFNRRLCKILYDNEILIFVYNNRIRKYSLTNGDLIENVAVRNAREMNISGVMINFV